MKQYDYLIVGAGLFGSVFAREATDANKKCLVVEKRSHVGGNIFTQETEGINVHVYGAHIFHTNNRTVWDYINRFAKFNHYVNSPIAIYNGEVYNLPFNMNTFHAMWGITTPAQAKAKLNEQIAAAGIGEPKNLQEQALKMVGRDVYEKLVKGYTEKQWGKKDTELPAFIIRRLPVRFTYDNNYFFDRFQGIAIGGYTQIAEKMLKGSDVLLNTDYFEEKERLNAIADKIVYTGAIDRYYDYCYGELEYRSLRFDVKTLNTDNFQGNAVINYTSADVPYTRTIEHKHFEFGEQAKTVVSTEYSQTWSRGAEPYYPINDARNDALYLQYKTLAEREKNLIFGGRLADYKYYDMDFVVKSALEKAERELRHN